MDGFAGLGWGVVVAAALGLLLLVKWINIVREYERAVVFRLGRVLHKPKGPGLIIVFWPIDRIVRVSLRTVVEGIPPQEVITRDNVSVRVNAVVYYRVLSPIESVINVEAYRFAMSQLAQTTLRSVLGTVDLDQLLAERETINLRLQAIVDRQADPWGLKVSLIEVKDVDLPADMTRAIARQAVAEREKRAKVIHAEGEFLAAERLAQAAAVMERQPTTLQLRYLQTLVEIASDRAQILPFPVPIDTIASLLRGLGLSRAPAAERAAPAPVAEAHAPAEPH